MISEMAKNRIVVTTKSSLVTLFSPILVIVLWTGMLLNNKTITVWFYKKDNLLFNRLLKTWRNLPMWVVEEFKPWRIISRRQVLESKHITMEVFEKLLPIDEAYNSLKGYLVYKKTPHLVVSSWKKNPILLTPEFICATYVLNNFAFATCPVGQLSNSDQKIVAEKIDFKATPREDLSNIGCKLSSPEALDILYRRVCTPKVGSYVTTSTQSTMSGIVKNQHTPDSLVEEYLDNRFNYDHFFTTRALIQRGNTKVLSEKMWNHLVTNPETEEIIGELLERKDFLIIFPVELFLAVYATRRSKGETSVLQERIIKSTGLPNWNDTVNFWLTEVNGYELEDMSGMPLVWKEELLIQEYSVEPLVSEEKVSA